jgi:hypothetical protein
MPARTGPSPRRQFPAGDEPAEQGGNAGVRKDAADGLARPVGRARRTEQCEQRRHDQDQRAQPAGERLFGSQ